MKDVENNNFENNNIENNNFENNNFETNDFKTNELDSNNVDFDNSRGNFSESEKSNTINHSEVSDSLKDSSFYTESFRKPIKKKNNSLFQLVLVALVSSILGGAIVGAALLFVVPAIQPYIKGYTDKLNLDDSTSTQGNSADSIKKVEIVQSSESPVTVIAEKAGPSIVGVRVNFKARDFFFGDQQGKGEASGIIIRNNGYIMTNYHVIQDAIDVATKKMNSNAKIEIILPNQKDKPYTATYIGGDAKTDLAVLKIDATNLPAAELGNSDDLKVGEMAVAIGNPGGLEYMGSVTMGIISGLDRTVQEEDGQELKLLQTDAAINPGNSGGALVNSKGQVIGINTVKIVASGYEGLGFAIPINKAKEITDSLIDKGYVSGRPKLGISIDTRYNAAIAKQYKMPEGVYVADVELMSAAQKAGIQQGDIITKFDGKSVKNRDELETIKSKHKPGDSVAVEVYRDGVNKALQIILGEDK